MTSGFSLFPCRCLLLSYLRAFAYCLLSGILLSLYLSELLFILQNSAKTSTSPPGNLWVLLIIAYVCIHSCFFSHIFWSMKSCIYLIIWIGSAFHTTLCIPQGWGLYLSGPAVYPSSWCVTHAQQVFVEWSNRGDPLKESVTDPVLYKLQDSLTAFV
jgi:hypothetical protein